ncbi:MAG: thioredoxin [Acidobacteria bacterium]|nr:thioredoxin [Acidobacteriota bacterium]
MAAIAEVSDDTFEQEVDKSTLPVLVDFSAEWCGPCKLLVPVLEEIAAEYEGKLRVIRVDVDNNRNSAARFGVLSVPTLLLMRDGEVKDQIVGNVPKRQLIDRINKLL